jgi:hypothetical protein
MYLKKIILKFYKELIFKFKKKKNLDLDKLDSLSLDELFNYFGTDKGSAVNNPYGKEKNLTSKKLMGHGYAEFYELYFNHFKNKEIRLLEIGTWKGASIASFYHYFKKAIIFCIDRNYKFQFRSDRVNFFYCDTSNKDQLNKFDNFLISKKSELFEIIIDDGSHIYSDILNNFENFFRRIKPGGFYVIEDFNHYKYYSHLNDSTPDSLEIDDIFHLLKVKKIFNSENLSFDFQNYCLNNISNIKIHKGVKADSYIAFISKR